MKTGYAILVGTIIGLLSGVGYAQLSIIGRVEQHETRVARLEKDGELERTRTDARIFELAGLVKSSLELNREFIAVMKLQNELLRQKESLR